MDHGLLIVLIWLAAAISLLVLIQVAILGALLLSLRGLLSKAWKAERKLRESGVDLYELSARAYRLLGYLETAMRESAEMGRSVNEGIADLRSRLARVEQSVSDFVDDAGETIHRARQAVSEPDFQFQGIVIAIRAVLRILGHAFQRGL
ncbi:MAG TPA: hypothetical protein VGX94_17215 [Terriglobia bacterium]|nr:hypothetical protein [Terriglobia bacterium]